MMSEEQRQKMEQQAAQMKRAGDLEQLFGRAAPQRQDNQVDPNLAKRLPMGAKSEGFTSVDLSKEEQEAFLKYCKKHLPAPTEGNFYDGKTADIKFDYFLTIYRICLMWAHNNFKSTKVEMNVKRRSLLGQEGQSPQVRALYLALCGQVLQKEQQLVSQYITLLGSTLPLHVSNYNRNIFNYQNHQTYYTLMQEAKMIVDEGRFALEGEVGMQSYSVRGVDTGRPMTREEAIECHAQLHEMSIAHMQGLKDQGVVGEQLAAELRHLPIVLGDKLFALKGIEPMELDCQTSQLKLEENDEEYKQMEIDYANRIKKTQF